MPKTLDLTYSLKRYATKKPPSMDSKIFCRIYCVGCGRLRMLKCLVKRCVKALRPPPGGAEQQQRIVSWISFQKRSFRSYTPPLSTSSLNSSMGGCAPYSSTAGMFTSSINTVVLRFGFAPSSVFLIFSNLPSMANCVTEEDVCAEKIS